jgi:hypothetical protein
MAMSWLQDGSGGALVSPPEMGLEDDEKSIATAVQAAGEWLARRWAKLEGRYGRRAAFAMALGAIVTFPLPGSLTGIVGVAEAIRGLRGFVGKSFGDSYLGGITPTVRTKSLGRTSPGNTIGPSVLAGPRSPVTSKLPPSPFAGRKPHIHLAGGVKNCPNCGGTDGEDHRCDL